MNLYQMIELANRPWVVQPDPPKKRKGPSNLCNTMANKARSAIAIAKYKAAFQGEEWVQTTVLCQRLKMDRGCVCEALRKWERKGIVEHRNFNDEPYHHKRGYEWRFK